MPSLDAVLAWARTTKIGLALEIKQPGPHTGRPPYPGIAERVADALTARAMVGRTLVHSFDHRTVEARRRSCEQEVVLNQGTTRTLKKSCPHSSTPQYCG